ncbi:DHHC family palmitoyltransferase [Aspergillus saccharolyticus JOP 1030-1]|uniref:Palmitoyltransferase n=1 Tax=Aspergillus saccharolyticus JOP 1030-1 TaxID=1450539 RepID=A0A319ARD4_9EURO|nr:zf-DHHC-domain-containing protein [Aspergillus saccharolyticus JOP 1030-1]PYH48942.1 zf-DHHC-domain-containing protein [Aspergillus saccharolyticus JOP 1030-1]
MARPDRRINLAVARAIPPFLLCVFIYASYLVTKPLCIDYLIHPLSKYDRGSRTGAGIVILVIYYILLLIVLITYSRLLHTVTWNAGLLARRTSSPVDNECAPPQSSGRHHRKKKKHRRHRSAEKADAIDRDVESGAESTADVETTPWDTHGLEEFYTKDVFVCQPDGRPLYCSTCCHFKPDRTHHCREVDRCVRKMDHFCPWVGGVVAETSFKFFIQFVFYTMLYCVFCLIICAVFTAEIRSQVGGTNPHLAVGIGFSVQLAMLNLTTIENINRRSAVWTLAIRVPKHLLNRLNPGSRWAPTFRTITYPLPPMPLTDEAQVDHQPAGEKHVFAILQTLPGENPFDLGSYFKNLQQVLGYNVIDWFLPLKQSPCAVRKDSTSFFELGPVVSRLKREAGLEKSDSDETRC